MSLFRNLKLMTAIDSEGGIGKWVTLDSSSFIIVECVLTEIVQFRGIFPLTSLGLKWALYSRQNQIRFHFLSENNAFNNLTAQCSYLWSSYVFLYSGIKSTVQRKAKYRPLRVSSESMNYWNQIISFTFTGYSPYSFCGVHSDPASVSIVSTVRVSTTFASHFFLPLSVFPLSSFSSAISPFVSPRNRSIPREKLRERRGKINTRLDFIVEHQKMWLSLRVSISVRWLVKNNQQTMSYSLEIGQKLRERLQRFVSGENLNIILYGNSLNSLEENGGNEVEFCLFFILFSVLSRTGKCVGSWRIGSVFICTG